MRRDKTAAIVVIGNEILSGKVVDSNAAFLARELRTLGVSLQRVLVVPDDLDAIGEAVRDYSRKFDVVFTSGGVGPTHDDITMEGIARGLGLPVVRHPELVRLLHEHIPGELDEAHLKMAEVPEGAELVFGGHLNFPTIHVGNIFIFPGIPELLRDKFTAVRDRFLGDPYYLRVVYLNALETSIAAPLNATMARFPELLLGSYPRLDQAEYSVRVTLESKDEDYLRRAWEDFMSRLPPAIVVRTE